MPDLSPSLPLYRHRLTRERFLAAIKTDVDKTIAMTRDLLRVQHIVPLEITDVILVSGSSRIPYIAAELRKVFPALMPRADVNADVAVAISAAIYARSAEDEVSVVPRKFVDMRLTRSRCW